LCAILPPCTPRGFASDGIAFDSMGKASNGGEAFFSFPHSGDVILSRRARGARALRLSRYACCEMTGTSCEPGTSLCILIMIGLAMLSEIYSPCLTQIISWLQRNSFDGRGGNVALMLDPLNLRQSMLTIKWLQSVTVGYPF
jgi:hypothetical protein